MTNNWINILTNVIGFLMVLFGAIQTYITSQSFNWITFIMCILGAVVAYFTGKSHLWLNK
jgi:hypothetical protein